MPAPVKGGKASKSLPAGLDNDTVALGVVAVFGVIATVTGHMHWMRTEAQCAPITDPLCRMIARLPAATKKRVLEQMDPALLVAGIYQVAGPSVAVEVQMAQDKKSGRIVRRAVPTPAAEPVPVPVPEMDPAKICDLTGVMQ